MRRRCVTKNLRACNGNATSGSVVPAVLTEKVLCVLLSEEELSSKVSAIKRSAARSGLASLRET